MSPQPAADKSAKPIIEATATLPIADDGLLATARTQWQFGDWSSLAQMRPEALENHPHGALLTLLSAAGHLQLGHTETGRKLTYAALAAGCDTGTAARLGRVLGRPLVGVAVGREGDAELHSDYHRRSKRRRSTMAAAFMTIMKARRTRMAAAVRSWKARSDAFSQM